MNMRKSTVSKKSNKSKKEDKELKRQESGVSKKSKQTVGDNDQSVVNQDQSALIDGDDPAEKLLDQVADEEIDNKTPEVEPVNDIKSLEGSIRNEGDPEERAGTEKDHP